MSTTLQDNPSAYRLEAALPDWCALRPHQTLLCGKFVALFLLLCYTPVSLPQTWHDVVSGRAARASTTDAFKSVLPLSEGMRHISIGQAAQWSIAQLEQLGGPRLLAISLAVVGTLQLLIWARILCRFAGHWAWSWGAICVFVTSMPSWSGLNRMVLGQTAFACFIWLVAGAVERNADQVRWSRVTRTRRWAMLILFGLWVNLHASFVVGLILLAILVLERLISLPESPTFWARLSDKELLSRLTLLESSILITLVNPAGLGLWKAMFWWPDHPAFLALGAWSPPSMMSLSAFCLAIGWAFWYRMSSVRRLTAWNLFALTASLAVAVNHFHLAWFTPLILTATAVHHRAAHNRTVRLRVASGEPDANPAPLRFAYTLISGLLLWLGICFSPASEYVSGTRRAEAEVIGHSLPFQAGQHLEENVAGDKHLVFCPQGWSDYLAAQTDLPQFLAADASLLPKSVVSDYHSIYAAQSNWNELAQKYAVTLLVIDKQNQLNLVREIRRGTAAWTIVYEDAQAIVAKKGSRSS